MSEKEINRLLRRKYNSTIGKEAELTVRGTKRKQFQNGPKKTPAEYSRLRRARFYKAGLTALGTKRKNHEYGNF